jgi:hypothetical protein
MPAVDDGKGHLFLRLSSAATAAAATCTLVAASAAEGSAASMASTSRMCSAQECAAPFEAPRRNTQFTCRYNEPEIEDSQGLRLIAMTCSTATTKG